MRNRPAACVVASRQRHLSSGAAAGETAIRPGAKRHAVEPSGRETANLAMWIPQLGKAPLLRRAGQDEGGREA